MLLAVRISSYGCTSDVWKALKKLELLSAASRATLTNFSCSPNFPSAYIARYTHAKHEKILRLIHITPTTLNNIKRSVQTAKPFVLNVKVLLPRLHGCNFENKYRYNYNHDSSDNIYIIELFLQDFIFTIH